MRDRKKDRPDGNCSSHLGEFCYACREHPDTREITLPVFYNMAEPPVMIHAAMEATVNAPVQTFPVRR